ncbi:MAG: molybdopterin-dependent oxidoreductase [Candidatus Rokubacteria bacterium]|nr:molybdopterin-dependent oxidoreductase [Candidatus Rokubacteria bacterium]MBI3826670.1 molybdopterin-dependent oxidoreductase [Candidatus Rokubacteria bacterium]
MPEPTPVPETPSSEPLNPSARDLPPREGGLASYPPASRWEHWEEYDPVAWPRKVKREYALVPTICFNCEAACGLLAYVDKQTLRIQKFEGNPAHPGSRGRNCAKGPATLNQIEDPERIRYPLRRAAGRGEGKWERVTWDEVLTDIAGRIRSALVEGRQKEVMYHLGRPGHELVYLQRVFHAWGIDGHNSHTNVCSASARAGYAFWMGMDRPSPDHANARFMLLLSSHLETGHYFNPHAQRIIEGKMRGAKICVIDTRLSNTASMADWWLAPWPGTEAALLLAIAHVLIREGRWDRDYVRKWVNWDEYLREERPDLPVTFEAFERALDELYARFTPEFAQEESGVDAAAIREVARAVGDAAGALATHIWRNTAAGNLGGWQVARALELLVVLTGSVGTPGGTAPSAWNKAVPAPPMMPPPGKVWSELLMPREYPLSFFEMSFLLPHFLREGRGKLAMYFTRVYNPVWTNPDGMSWIEMLTDESKVERHACLTPVWSETAWFADYVLPMGHASERHDLMSQETHAARWIGFRQPVLRLMLERQGRTFDWTWQAHEAAGIGQVWEEDEFWIELSWRIDPDGALGIRKYFESPYRPGEKLRIEEFYRWIFEHSVPGLPETAQREGLTPLAYMRKYGAFLVADGVYRTAEQPLPARDLEGTTVDPATRVVSKNGQAVGVEVDGVARVGFPTPSRRLEFYSLTLKEWKWAEQAVPGYIRSHVHWAHLDRAQGEMVLIPTFRLPTLIHTRSGNAKWLYEISHTNPIWIHPEDGARLAVATGDLLRVETAIGHFVDRAWVTEAIRPGIIACSHHLGRWRLREDTGGERWSTALVELERAAPGQWRMRQVHGIAPFTSTDPDSGRIWWEESGVNQNLTFPVQPDPVSGQHCWHQRVRVARAGPDDRYGDIVVDTNKSYAVYRDWLALARPAPGPGNLRRPLWLPRAFRPDVSTYKVED